MTRLIRVELLKIHTTRLALGLAAVAAALTGLDAILRASRAGNGRLAPLDTAAGFRTVLTLAGFALLMSAVLGVSLTSGEFRHGTATSTFLATPDRCRVLVAKVLAAAMVAPAIGAAGFAVAAGVDLGFIAAHGDHVPLALGTILRDGAGAMLGAGLLGALGAGLGTLVRNQVGAVIGVYAWGLVVEGIIGGLFSSIGPYLPFTASTTIAGAALGGGGFGFRGSSTASPLPFFAAAALVALVATLVAAVAARTTLRKDIT
jgi:ABC-type transport system involved in multi-copper enzyme maturation permease subunit